MTDQDKLKEALIQKAKEYGIDTKEDLFKKLVEALLKNEKVVADHFKN